MLKQQIVQPTPRNGSPLPPIFSLALRIRLQ
jgi:hypothetical protein